MIASPPAAAPSSFFPVAGKACSFKAGCRSLIPIGCPEPVPLPQGSLDLKAQTYHSRTRPSPRLDKGGASRESTRAW